MDRSCEVRIVVEVIVKSHNAYIMVEVLVRSYKNGLWSKSQ